MCDSGKSREFLELWAGNHKNRIIFTGYSVTVYPTAMKVIRQKSMAYRIREEGVKKIETMSGKEIDLKMENSYISFSAHSDSEGTKELIRRIESTNIVLGTFFFLVMMYLVHGRQEKMFDLKALLERETLLGRHLNVCTEVVVQKQQVHTPSNQVKALVRFDSHPYTGRILGQMASSQLKLLQSPREEMSGELEVQKKKNIVEGLLVDDYGNYQLIQPTYKSFSVDELQ